MSSSVSANVKQHVVVTFNGGGVMGINSAHIYSALEHKVLEKAKNHDITLEKLSDAVTCFGGTSIGSFHAAILANGSDGDKLLDIYKDYGQIFGAHARTLGGLFSPKYNREGVEKAITKYLGHDTNLTDLNKLIAIPSFSLSRGEPTVWSYLVQDDDSVLHTISHATLAHAVAASTAAPVILGAAKVHYDNQEHFEIDGGLFANNPTALLLDMLEIHAKSTEELKNLVVINIGTGAMNTKLADSNLAYVANGGAKSYLENKYIFGVISSSTDAMATFLAHNHVDRHDGQYFRFQPMLPDDLFGIDNDSKKHLDKLADYMDKNYIPNDDIQAMLENAADAIINAHINNIAAGYHC